MEFRATPKGPTNKRCKDNRMNSPLGDDEFELVLVRQLRHPDLGEAVAQRGGELLLAEVAWTYTANSIEQARSSQR